MRGKILVLLLVFLLALVSLGYGLANLPSDTDLDICQDNFSGNYISTLRSQGQPNFCCESDLIYPGGGSSGDLAKLEAEPFLTDTHLCKFGDWKLADAFKFKIVPITRGWDQKIDFVSNADEWFSTSYFSPHFNIAGGHKVLPIPGVKKPGSVPTTLLENYHRRSAKFLPVNLNGKGIVLECCDRGKTGSADADPRACENNIYSETEIEISRMKGIGEPSTLITDKFIDGTISLPNVQYHYPANNPIVDFDPVDIDINNWNDYSHLIVFFKVSQNFDVNLELLGDWDLLLFKDKLINYALNTPQTDKWVVAGIPIQKWNNVKRIRFSFDTEPTAGIDNQITIGKTFLLYDRSDQYSSAPIFPYTCSGESIYKPDPTVVVPWINDLDDIMLGARLDHHLTTPDPEPVGKSACEGLGLGWTGECCGNEMIEMVTGSQNPPQKSLPEYMPGTEGSCWNNLKVEDDQAAMDVEFSVNYKPTKYEILREDVDFGYKLTWKEDLEVYKYKAYSYRPDPKRVSAETVYPHQYLCCPDGWLAYENSWRVHWMNPKKGCTRIKGDCWSPYKLKWIDDPIAESMGKEPEQCYKATWQSKHTSGRIRIKLIAQIRCYQPRYVEGQRFTDKTYERPTTTQITYNQGFFNIDHSENPKVFIEPGRTPTGTILTKWGMAQFPYRIINKNRYPVTTAYFPGTTTPFPGEAYDTNWDGAWYKDKKIYVETFSNKTGRLIYHSSPVLARFNPAGLGVTEFAEDGLNFFIDVNQKPIQTISNPASESKNLKYTCFEEECDFPLPGEPPYTITNSHPDVYEMYFVSGAFGLGTTENLIEGAETFNEAGYVRVKKLPLRYLWENNTLVKCGDNLPSYTENEISPFEAWSSIFSVEQVNDSCSVRGNHFCYENSWDDEDSGIFDANQRTNEKQALGVVNDTIEGYQAASCCPADACWNGTMCVGNMLDPNATIESHHGYGCFDGQWTELTLLYNWDGDQSHYCPRTNQCLVSTGGSYDYDSSADYLQGNLPYCINNGDYIYDHYCQAGKWTSRTKLLALELLGLVNNTGDPNDYELFCDNFSVIWAGRNYQPLMEHLIGPINISNNQYTNCVTSPPAVAPAWCVNNFCRLEYDDSGTIKEVFAMSLNKPINDARDSFTQTLGLGRDYCNNVQSGGWDDCGNPKFWYNRDLNSFMYTTSSSIDLSGPTFFDVLKQWLQGIIDWITGYQPSQVSYDYNFTQSIKDFNKVFLVKRPALKVTAAFEQFGDYSFILARYDDFNLDMCTYIQGRPATQQMNYQTEWGVNVVCNQTGNDYEIFMDKYLDIWPDITRVLNI